MSTLLPYKAILKGEFLGEAMGSSHQLHWTSYLLSTRLSEEKDPMLRIVWTFVASPVWRICLTIDGFFLR